MATSGVLRPDQIRRRWNDIAALLERAAENSCHEVLVEDVMNSALDGMALIAVVVEDDGDIVFAAACEVVIYPRLRTLHITHLAGKNIRRYREHFAIIEQAARELNCGRIQALCYPAAARLFQTRAGFAPLYQMIGKEVTP